MGRIRNFRVWYTEQNNAVHTFFVMGLPLILLLLIFVCYLAFPFILPELGWILLIMFCFPALPLISLSWFIPNYDKDKMLKENEDYYQKMNNPVNR